MSTETLPASKPAVEPQVLEAQRNSRVVWFEIPVANMERAQKFYETIFKTRLTLVEFGAERIAVFPYAAPSIGGGMMLDV